MNIISGSGRRRTVLALPHASVVKAAPQDVQTQALDVVCNMLGVKETNHGKGVAA